MENRILHYFLPDKLVFKNITMEEMRGLAKYGHKIGKFGEDIEALDYVVIEESHQFLEICKGTSTSVHLIEHHEGRFRLMNTRGSDKNLRKHFESTKLCSDFPHCNCEADNLILRFSFSIYKDELLTCEINVSELLPKMLELLKLQDYIDFYQLKCWFKRVQESSISTTTLGIGSPMKLDELKSAPFDEQIVQLVECISESECIPTFEWGDVKQSAVTTLFPQLLTGSSSRMTEYKESHFFGEKGINQMNETLGFYFIVNLIMKQETVDYVNVRDLTHQLFTNCFERIKHHISFRSWGNSMYRSASIKSFKFSNKRFFQFLNSLAKSQSGMISISKLINEYITHQTVDKWVQALVNDNLFDLLTLVIGLEKHGKIFESDELVVLAVAHADVPVIELVAKHYEKTCKKVSDIQLKLIRDANGQARRYPATLLHVAALRGNYSVMEKLLESYEFKSMLNIPQIQNIISFCICDTQKSQDQVKTIIKIIDKLLQFNSALIQSPNLQNNNLILVPNSHVDLIMHLINLGLDIHATDDDNENVAHLSARYMSPLEYDKLLHFIYETGAVVIFHSKDKSLETPLHNAVRFLEVLDSTLELFTSANVDFNETTKFNDTVLHLATQFQKHTSAHLLDSLVQAGADFNKRLLNVSSVLHIASKEGNLTALRYFITKGIDVNIRGLKNITPLFYAIRLSKQKVQVILHTLVQHGADLNATDKLLRTPLSYALEWKKYSDVDSEIIEFLKSSGAQVFPNIVNVKAELERWYTDNIIKNVENLTETTTVSGEFESGGQKFLTYQEIEQLVSINVDFILER
ncbi:unnamed protein product [Orchesella dallaii]|uniref:Ankyrin repeat protein n=1 Tax=Orchesella dallaii TaxID=48710 RepID=A0ABP1RET9_9HEXA